LNEEIIETQVTISKLKSLIFQKSFLLVFFLFLTAVFFRFYNYDLPALLVADSVKYFIPLQIIKVQNFEWNFARGLNFSYLLTTIMYFIQSFSNGSIEAWIPIQKFIAVLETILVYFLIKEINPRLNYLAFGVALYLSLNPLKLFYENTMMPESVLNFLLVLSLFIGIKLIKELDLDSKLSFRQILLAVFFGVNLALIVLTREMLILKNLVLAAMFIFGIYEFLNKKNLKLIKLSGLSFLSCTLILLPIMFYNFLKFKNFTVSVVPMAGAQIWSLNEKMIKNSNAEPRWVKEVLLSITNQYKIQKKLNPELEDRDSYLMTCSVFGVAGREGRVIDPTTKKRLSPQEFSKLMAPYIIKVNLDNPSELFKRAIQGIKKTFFSPNLNFKDFYKSTFRTWLAYEPFHIRLVIPHSLSEPISPKLKKLEFSNFKYLTENKWCKDPDCKAVYENSYPLAVSYSSDEAFVYKVNNPNIAWINLLSNFPFAGPVLIIFLFSLFFFIYKGEFKNLDKVQYLALGISLFFFASSSLVCFGDNKYSVYQLVPMMIFSISILLKNKNSN
jgi:hypothetical protein